MSTITWIVIILIIISIAVTVTEVGIRFIILEKSAGGGTGANANVLAPMAPVMNRNLTRLDFNTPQLEAICGNEVVGATFAGLC